MPTAVKKACPTKQALAQLKSLNSDQQNRLQTKHQLDLDLLDDIRNFLKQRATIEKEYGQSLLKLCTSYLQKKDYAVSAFELQHSNGRNLVTVWKSVLESNETFARESLSLSDQLSSQGAEPLKQFRATKVTLLKRSMDQIKALQSDLQTNVAEFSKTAKTYQETEHETHETRIKASELDEKLKKKATGIFTSRATMEKTSQKLAAKRDAFELKSISVRNEYLLSLAACNAANSRFWQTDLIELTQQLDFDVHTRMRDSLLTAMKNELQLACSKQERFGKLLMELSDVSQTYQMECFLEEYASLFKEQPAYVFEPVDGDPITYLLGNETDLLVEAKRIASRHVADVDAKQSCERQLKLAQQALRDAQGCLQATQVQQAGSTSTTDEVGVQQTTTQSVAQQTGDLEARIDDLKHQLRRLELQLCRSEAKLNLFRSLSSSAIDIDDIISKLHAELLAAKPAQVPSPPATPVTPVQPSLAPVSSNSHFRVSSKASVNSTATTQSASASVFNDGHRELAAAPSSVTQVSTWDDEPDMLVIAPSGQNSQEVEFADDDLWTVAALYDFDGSNEDELPIRAGERLRAVCQPTINEQGWMQVENSRGQRGIVPETYVQYTSPERQAQASVAMATGMSPSASVNLDRSPSANPGEIEPVYSNYWNDNPRENATATAPAVQPAPEVPSPAPIPAPEPAPVLGFDRFSIVRALYEYEAQSEDELNLQEGDYLLVSSQGAADGDDDGWWFGCLLKQAQVALSVKAGVRAPGTFGVFPSLVVEAIDQSEWPALQAMKIDKETLESLDKRISLLKKTQLTNACDEQTSDEAIVNECDPQAEAQAQDTLAESEPTDCVASFANENEALSNSNVGVGMEEGEQNHNSSTMCADDNENENTNTSKNELDGNL